MPQIGVNNGQKSLATAVRGYLEESQTRPKAKDTGGLHDCTRLLYLSAAIKLRVEDIDRKNMLKFVAFLRDEKEQSPQPVHNKFENLMTFLKLQGARGLVSENDWPPLYRGRTGNVRAG